MREDRRTSQRVHGRDRTRILSPPGRMSSIFLALATSCVLVLAVGGEPGCVETAECDQSITCDDTTKVCFRYECKAICEEDEDCEEGASCQSCEANDACFGVMLRACVTDEQMSMMEETSDGG